IYCDRPREVWAGQVAARLASLPLDVDDLMTERRETPFTGLPQGTTMGHVHLRVAEIPSTPGFYRDTLGLALMAHLPPARFLAAGGYHHHIGANTWGSAGASPAPPGAAALRHFTIVLPSAADRERLVEALEARAAAIDESEHGPRVQDPSGNTL